MNRTKRLAKILHDKLMECFPAAFPRDYDAMRPLKISIETDILVRLTAAGEPVEPALLRQVLANHTGRAGYLLALLHHRGDRRYDLDGNPVGTVDDAARAEAAERLAIIQQRQRVQSERYQAHIRQVKALQAAKAQRQVERERKAVEKQRCREEHERNRQHKLEDSAQTPAATPTSPSAPRSTPAVSNKKRRILSLKDRKK